MGVLSGTIGTMLAVANGSRASIGVTEKHVSKMLETVAAGADIGIVLGARSMSTRAAFVMALRDGDTVRVVYADVRRCDAYQGPAGAFPGFPSGPLGPVLPVKGESPEKHATARAASRGIETHAFTLAPEKRDAVLAWARANATHVLRAEHVSEHVRAA